MKLFLLTIVIPLFGSLFMLLLSKKLREFFSFIFIFFTFIFSLITLFSVFKGKEIYLKFGSDGFFNISFLADGLSSFFALVSSFVSLLIILYSLGYMKDYEEKHIFYFWTTFFVGSMMGLVFSSNLLLMYCFWELTGIASYRLIAFYRKKEDTYSANRAFLITFFGASLFLVGIVFVYLQFNTLDIKLLKYKNLNNFIAFLFLFGIFSKSAQLPFETWLPDAGCAPTPVTSLLHAAVLVKIGIYGFMRLFNNTFLVSDLFLNIVMFLSVITILISGSSALREKDIKRILAYSTISQLGYIIFILALFDKFSLINALVYVLAHSLAKAGLFLCAGSVEHSTHTKDIERLGGLIKSMPIVALTFLMCSFSIIGIAPFLGFWSKLFFIFSLFKRGSFIYGSLAIIGAFLTLLYLGRFFDKVFLGEEKIKPDKVSGLMLNVSFVFGILSLFLGLCPNLLFKLLEKIL